MTFTSKTASRFFAIMVCVLFLGVCAQAEPPKELKGYYEGDDGGAYFVRQIGDKVYWFGEGPNGAWANVLMGTINGKTITARFWDVPKGRTQGAGEITFSISADGATLTKVSASVPFGTRSLKLAANPPELRSRPQGFTDSTPTLTGVWGGDDYETYYVRETPAGDVVWISESGLWGGPGGYSQPAITRVFIGKKIKQAIIGDWVDLPKGKAAGNGVLTVNMVGPQELTIKSISEGIDATRLWRSLPNSLRGFADLHTHPMVNLGFGGKLVQGGPDVGSLMPADADCNHGVVAKSISQALGRNNGTHGGWDGDKNPCGDNFRSAFQFVFAMMKDSPQTGGMGMGYPNFRDWPKWNDITHQKMWVDWIRRSYDGGQRIMVALAVHNATLAAIASGPTDGPLYDKESADLQILEMKRFVDRHKDFMEIAYSSADVRRIVSANKLAVILGVEVDHIGNFNTVPAFDDNIRAEIRRLYSQGVRYIFPVHVLDNAFGHTAAYEDLFNYSDKRESGRWWKLVCAQREDELDYDFSALIGDDIAPIFKNFISQQASLKISLDLSPPPSPKCPYGERNGNEGLTPQGRTAINEMMKLGMLIDIDHMSQVTANETLTLAEKTINKYPLVSGHNNMRSMWPPDKARSDEPLRMPLAGNENARTEEQLIRIGKLGGMFGLGTDSVLAELWDMKYVAASYLVGKGSVAIGSDLNGLVKGPRPADSDIYTSYFTRPKTGDKVWDFRKDGVAHYGMLTDFFRHVAEDQKYGAYVNGNLMNNAENFAKMWEKAERSSKFVK
jgi:Membrane dipeptidase (Peptidase family M19)